MILRQAQDDNEGEEFSYTQIVSGALLLIAFGWSLWLIAYALCDMMEVFK